MGELLSPTSVIASPRYSVPFCRRNRLRRSKVEALPRRHGRKRAAGLPLRPTVNTRLAERFCVQLTTLPVKISLGSEETIPPAPIFAWVKSSTRR